VSEGPARRVRLDEAGERGGRTGCLAMGAVLGILAGVMVALYVLPPLLKSMYGEKVVRPGEARVVGGVTLQVVAYRAGADGYCVGVPGCPAESVQVHIRVLSTDRWEPRPDQLRVEFDGIRTWIEAMDPVPEVEDTALAFEAGVERIVVLRFPLPLGDSAADTRAVAVHVTTPRARLDIDETLRR